MMIQTKYNHPLIYLLAVCKKQQTLLTSQSVGSHVSTLTIEYIYCNYLLLFLHKMIQCFYWNFELDSSVLVMAVRTIRCSENRSKSHKIMNLLSGQNVMRTRYTSHTHETNVC